MNPLIAIEGPDGSGKATQARSLAKAIGGTILSFPRYESYWGQRVKEYLHSDTHLDAFHASLLYALDRQAAQDTIQMLLQMGPVILDRYVASNLAHQCARVSKSERRDLKARLLELEYAQLGIKPPDLTVFLNVPPKESQRLMASRETLDNHESDLEHLEAAWGIYHELSRADDWVMVPCMSNGNLRDVDAIASEVMDRVQHIFSNQIV